jgi:hypothetical protein
VHKTGRGKPQSLSKASASSVQKTPNFIKLITARDPDSDLVHPVLVRRHAIAESLRLMMAGKFNEQVFVRPFHGKGSLTMVTQGSFVNRQVRLEALS